MVPYSLDRGCGWALCSGLAGVGGLCFQVWVGFVFAVLALVVRQYRTSLFDRWRWAGGCPRWARGSATSQRSMLTHCIHLHSCRFTLTPTHTHTITLTLTPTHAHSHTLTLLHTHTQVAALGGREVPLLPRDRFGLRTAIGGATE